jgi:hypothetical protein
MTGWRHLFAELDRWPAGKATLWWRDDDASAGSPALDRLLALADKPLALAVVPAQIRTSLADRLAGGRVDVLQHGFAHINHQGPGEKKAEFGSARPLASMQEELGRGWQRLAGLFGRQALPVMVPPWNRIDSRLAATLADFGYIGLSTYRAREARRAGVDGAMATPGGLVQVNTHVDILAWGAKAPRFIGLEAALGLVVSHLAGRRTGIADPGEPTGLLTHHLTMDDASFAFAEAFLERSAAHPAVQWLAARDIFAGERI